MPILQGMKVAPDPVMSEVVQRRLELLLAEVRPRHALADEPADADPGRADGRGPAPPGAPGGGLTGEGPPGGESIERGTGVDPRRSVEPPSGLVAQMGSRLLEFGREHLAAVVLVLLVGCGWTAYSLFQARSTPVAAAAVPSVVATPSADPTPAAKVLVHVLGAVREPGIVELAEGSRVADAIAAAGGLTGSANPGELNLAAVVADGSQVVIGTSSKPRGEVRVAEEAQGGSGASGGSGVGGGSAPVSLNTATLAQLDSLPGIGPVTAQKILDWREQHGGFKAVSELQEVDGIGPKTYADLAPHVRV